MAKQYSSSSSTNQSRSTSYNKYKDNKNLYKQLAAAEKGLNQYKNQYRNLIQGAIGQLNKPFEFDAQANPVYRQYSNDYRLMGNIAAAQSEAQTEVLSGGFGTTYGGTVANQQLQGYLANEKQIIPQLYQVEKANALADQANAINQANMYAQLQGQDLARSQAIRSLQENNRDYAYQKWLNDYMAHATSVEKSTATERNNDSTTSITDVASGRSGRTTGRSGRTTGSRSSKLPTGAFGSEEGAKNWMIQNGYSDYLDNLLSRQEYVNERFKTNRNYYNGYEGKGDPEAEKKVDTDYSIYLFNYLNKLRKGK